MIQSFLITLTQSIVHTSVLLSLMTAAAAKAAGVLAIALIVAACMRRGSAAARHLLLTLALAMSLLLPLAAIITPSWTLAVLPPPAKPTMLVIPQTTPQITPPLIEQPSPDQKFSSSFHEETETTASLSRSIASAPPVPPVVHANLAAKPVHHFKISTVILAIWIAGTMVITLGWMVGIVAAYRLAGSARPIEIGAITAAADNLCAELRIRRRVAVRIGGGISMPLTTGMFRPALLLPTDANHWPAGKVQSVLLHELAHVKRHDCATQLLAQLVCAIYWFNPLAWLAAGRLRAERERACDDFVLQKGADPVSYADLLLTVAASLRGRSPADLTAIAMARRSGLRDRVTKVLTAAVNRRPVNRFAAIAAMLIALTLVIPLGAVHLASRSAVARAATTPAVTTPLDKSKSTDDSTASPETDRLVIVPPTGETKTGYLTGGGYPLVMNDRFRAPDAAYRPGPWFFLLNSDLSEPIQINPLNLGLPADAPIEEIVKRTATGDIYQPTLGTLVPVRGSLMAPLDMPADNRWVVEDIKFYDFIRTMTRKQIARKVLAYHHAHPEKTAWQVKAGQHFAVLRANGGISCSAVRTTGKDLCIFYVPIGSVKLATTQPATRPVTESVTQEPGKTIRLFVHDSRVQLRQNNNVIEADRIAISPVGGVGCTVDVDHGMVRANCADGHVLTGSRLQILSNGKITAEDGRITATTKVAATQARHGLRPR